MMREMNNDRNRQESEILALSSIYNCEEFSYIMEDVIQCYLNIFPKVDNGTLRLENIYETDETNEYQLLSKYRIKYLPLIRVYLHFPNDYPTKSPPNFYITNSWLSPWQVSLICQKLDEIWLANEGQEVLYLWFEFLRNDLLNFFQIKDSLDISFLYMVHNNLEDYFNLNLVFQNDIRAKYSPLYFNPLKFFLCYNKLGCNLHFERNYYTCSICLEQYSGKGCIKFKDCSHVYCRKCMKEYIAIKINENTVSDIVCPSMNCNIPIAISDVKDLCPSLFSKYESSLLNLLLNTMKDIIFCPRISCQCPFIKDTDDTLGICDKCDYIFCCYCYKAYHGAVPCAMTTFDTQKLIQDYQNGNKAQRMLLERKYGRKQIQKVVEKYLTNKYLQENAKACPNCQTMTVKIDGCNKMTCTYCKAYFCWLCGAHITTENAYEHFLSPDNTCYKRLFEENEV